MLQTFGTDIWISDGPAVVGAMGFRYPTRMAVIRLADGALFVWSPVVLNDALRGAVDALGDVRFIVAPNGLHHVFVGDWTAVYPAARLVAAPGVAGKRKDLTIDVTLGDAPVADWGGAIDHVILRNAIATEVVFFHTASGTAIFTDLIQQLPQGWYAGWRRIVAKLDLMTAAQPSVPRKFRLALTDRRAARAAVARVLAWPTEKLLMAHGPAIETGGRAVIARAFAWLVGRT